ncbi:MAG: PrsW family intramembrane metalloprotease [Eubacteriaceae bacterium]|nr:PrsW family intramembrane metalloprotease [Eubacteriaceae bacterium]
MSMYPILLIILGVLPAAVIIFYILRFDSYNQEPRGLLALLFLSGMIICVPVYFAEVYLDRIIYDAFGQTGVLYTLIRVLLCVALVEEGFKFLAVRIFGYWHRDFDEIYDGMIYCVMVGMGFAAVENILYVLGNGVSVAIARALTAVPVHAVFGLLMGYYLSLSKFDAAGHTKYAIASLLAPVILHAAYDFLLMVGYLPALLLVIVIINLMYKRSFFLIRSVYAIPPIVPFTDPETGITYIPDYPTPDELDAVPDSQKTIRPPQAPYMPPVTDGTDGGENSQN